MNTTTINLNTHKQVLMDILKFIYSSSMTKTILGFKGGTAAMLFYDLPRMSVDLDFDLLLDVSKDGNGEDNTEDQIFEYLKKELSVFGEVKQSFKKRFTLFYLINYKSGFWNIKVEISRRESISSYETKNYLGVPVLVMKKEDMVANKCLALVARNKPAARDFFDVWFFLKEHWGINFDIIAQKTGQTPKEFFNEAIFLVEKQKNSFFLNGLGELVDDSQKLWIKNSLKDELVFQLKLVREVAV